MGDGVVEHRCRGLQKMEGGESRDRFCQRREGVENIGNGFF